MRLLTITLLLPLVMATQANEQPQRLDSEARKTLSELQAQLRAASPVDSVLPIIEQMAAIGPAAERQVTSAITSVLRSDAQVIAAAIRKAGDLSGLEQALAQQDTLRQEARANIKVLAKDETMDKAKDYHGQLLTYHQQFSGLQELRSIVATALSRRPALKDIHARFSDDLERRFSADDEAELQADALAFLGLDLETLKTIDAAQSKPADPAQARLWTYRQNRRIEAWNQSQRPLMSQGEWDNLVAVNTYREALGVTPLEVDHRLLQAARKHSKEMAEKGYFSHSSPTAGRKSHTDRMKAEGYGKGHSENIANGAPGGERAFWMWFASPPHHKNMVNADRNQFGVGQWGSLWTQVFGQDRSLMRLSPEQREDTTTPKGTILEPQ